ncbi:MAG: hypothetical protein WCV91_04310 [Candidatus Margulisiibacteriota bacterium]
MARTNAHIMLASRREGEFDGAVMGIQVAGLLHSGCEQASRSALFVTPSPIETAVKRKAFGLCQGMVEHNGAEASALAAEYMVAAFGDGRGLGKVFHGVHTAMISQRQRFMMGTAAVAVLVDEEKGSLFVGSVGNCRAYLFREDGSFMILSADNIRQYPMRLFLPMKGAAAFRHYEAIRQIAGDKFSLLTALGVDGSIAPGMNEPLPPQEAEVKMAAGDVLVLSSSELPHLLDHDALAQEIEQNRSKAPLEIGQTLYRAMAAAEFGCALMVYKFDGDEFAKAVTYAKDMYNYLTALRSDLRKMRENSSYPILQYAIAEIGRILEAQGLEGYAALGDSIREFGEEERFMQLIATLPAQVQALVATLDQLS